MISLEQARTVSEIVQALGIGIGSILGGLGALKVLGEWRDKRKYKRRKSRWLELYPKDRLGEDFKILYHSFSEDTDDVVGSSPHLYICDDRTRTRHWIVNPATLEILGFNHDEAKGVAKKELEKYKVGEQVDLTPY